MMPLELTVAQIAQLPEDVILSSSCFVTTCALQECGADLTGEAFHVNADTMEMYAFLRRFRRKRLLPVRTLSHSRYVEVEHTDPNRHGKLRVRVSKLSVMPTFIAFDTITSVVPADDIYMEIEAMA